MFKIKQSFKTGLGFGLTSGVITTLGLIVGLNSSTHSRPVIIAGILVIAVADAFSDALGIHISEESDNKKSQKEIWEATFATLFTKFFIALTFIIPISMICLYSAVTLSILWGLFLIAIFSFYIARQKKQKPLKVVLEHIFIAILVVFISNYIGQLVSKSIL